MNGEQRKEPKPGRLRPILSCILLPVVALLPLLYYGAPSGHDFFLHVQWAKHFSAQFLSGEVYPRWLIDANEGLGSPAFYIYPPVAFYAFSAVTFLTGGGVVWSLGVSTILSMVVGSLGVFVWLRHRVGERAAWISSAFYTLHPYHAVVDPTLRFAYAETWAFAWVPWTFWAADTSTPARPLRYLGFAALSATVVATHPPTALVLAPVVLGYCLLAVPRSWTCRLALVLTLGLSYGVSAFYALTAFGFGEHIHLATRMYVEAREHLFDPRELLSGDLQVYDSVLPNFNYALLVVMFANLAAATVATVQRARSPKDRLWLFFFLVLWGAIAAQFDSTGIIWSSIDLLHRIQFPWRLNVLAVLACAVLFSRPLSEPGNGRPASLTVAVLLAAAFGTSAAYHPALRKFGEEFYRARLASNLDASEYRLGSVAGAGKLFAGSAKVAVLRGRCDRTVRQWSAQRIEVRVDCAETTTVAIRQFDFAGRSLHVNGVRTASLSMPQYHGVIVCSLEPGTHTLEVYPVSLPFERTANRISMGSAGLLLFFSLGMWLKAARAGRHRRAISESA